MTTTYESIDPSSTPDTAYTRIHQTPQHDFETVPVTGDYLIPTETGDLSTAQTSSPATAWYESIGAPDPATHAAYTPLQIPQHGYEEAP